MTINLPEGAKEQARVGHIIMSGGLNASLNVRRELIKKTVQAWYNKDPKHAKNMASFLAEYNKVDVGVRKEHANAYTQIRLPSDLFYTLRHVFNVFAPDQETFGTFDDDIRMLMEEFPGLSAQDPRKNRGKLRR